MKNINELPQNDKIKILDIKIDYIDPFKVSNKSNSKFLKKALDYAHKLSLNKK